MLRFRGTMSIKIIKPDSIDQCTNNFKTIFLAGTIDNGNSFDWQKDIEYSLDNLNQNGIKTSKEINKQIIVIAPDKFWRKGNIEVVCNRMNVPVYSDYKDGLNALIKAIGN